MAVRADAAAWLPLHDRPALTLQPPKPGSAGGRYEATVGFAPAHRAVLLQGPEVRSDAVNLGMLPAMASGLSRGPSRDALGSSESHALVPKTHLQKCAFLQPGELATQNELCNKVQSPRP